MKAFRTTLATLIAFVVVIIAAPTASPIGPWQDWVRHPSIAAQPASGQIIKDMAVKNGELHIGHGDYGANTGPVYVATANLSTGATDVKATLNSEEINTFRTYNGNLYIPWIDTKDVGGIYTSDQSGVWSDYGRNVENVHIFDVAVLPNGVQVAVGSANSLDRTTFLGATAFVSYDGGQTWRDEMHDLTNAKDPNVSGYERYYWVVVIAGKAYIQARDNYAAYGEVIFPIRVFDGTRWSSINKQSNCFVSEGHRVEVFEDKAYCGNGWVFNGKRTTTSGGISAFDFYQYNGSLYALQQGGQIMQLMNGSWTQVGTAPSGSRSLAVTASHFYVGGSDGWVRSATR